MYLEHFNLAVNPFGISPRLDFLYKSDAFEESMAHLVYGLDNSEAIVLITGSIGTGKTMAIQSFLTYLGDRFVSALVTNTNVDAKELLKLILEDLGHTPIPGSDKSDLLITFKNFLIEQSRQGRRVIIVVDEAQNLSREVLEEIRLLTNLGQGAEQPVQVILVGQPELEEAVMRPDLAQLRQRIRVHYKLSTLSRHELQEYVDHRIQVAGGAAGLFSSSSLDRIYSLSSGIPRVVNTMCGEALLAAFVAGRTTVKPEDIEDNRLPHLGTPALDESGVGGNIQVEAPAPAPPAPTPIREPQRQSSPPPVAHSPQVDIPVRHRRSDRSPLSRGLGWWIAVLALAGVVVALVMSGQAENIIANLTQEEQESTLQEPGMTVDQPANTVAEAPVEVSDSNEMPEENTNPEVQDDAGEHEKTEEATKLVADSSVQEVIDTPPPGTPGFYLHVCSFRTRDRADSQARRFNEDLMPASVHQELKGGQSWYRVYLGPIIGRDHAVYRANQLLNDGVIKYYKVIRAEDGDNS